MRTKYKRVLLKLSGESLMGSQHYGIDPVRLEQYATQIKEVVDSGVQVAIVIGGGNIFRGLQGAAKGFDRVKGDQMGMLATVINSLALSSALEAIGQKAKVLTASRRWTAARWPSCPAVPVTPSSLPTPALPCVAWRLRQM